MAALTGFDYSDPFKSLKKPKQNNNVAQGFAASTAPYNPNLNEPAPTVNAGAKTPNIDLTSSLKKGTGVYPSQYGANMSQADVNALADYGTAWNRAKDAGDTAGMTAANAGANNIRQNKYGFNGGASGSEYNTLANQALSQGGYGSTYGDQIQQLLNKATNNQFSYDPNSDLSYQNYIKQAKEQAQTAYDNITGSGNVPGIRTSSAVQGQANASKNKFLNDLGNAQSTYEDKAYQRYLQDQQANRDSINTLLNLDTTGYTRTQNALNRTDKINEALGYANPTAGTMVSQSVRDQLKPYANDYTAYANANPNTELGKAAKVLANEKMFNDLSLLKKYGDVYTTANEKSRRIDDEAKRISNKYAPQIAQGQIDSTKFENEFKRLRNLNYPEDEAAQRAATYANIAQGYAQNAISQQNADTNRAQLGWEMNLNNPANTLKNAQANYYNVGKTNTATNNTIDDYANTMKSMFTKKSDLGTTFDTVGARNYLIGLVKDGAPDNMVDGLAKRFGVTIR